MSLSIRSKFIGSSVSITIVALLLFGSVLHDRAKQYKHEQEIKSYRVLTGQLFHLVYKLGELNLIKQSLSEEISSDRQPAKIYAVLNKKKNNVFSFAQENVDTSILKNVLQDAKKSHEVKEGTIKQGNAYYYWTINKLFSYSNKKYTLLIVYPLSSSITSEFLEFFGLPFFISGFILCWIMVWASIILSSLVLKLQRQKLVLSEQAIDIEQSRDQALHKNLEKSYFLANMSHEIRTPLTSIIGFAESSLDIDQSMKERIKATKIIIKSGKHLLDIINEILDLSKIETGKLEIEQIPMSIIGIVEEVNQLILIMAEEKGLDFEIQYTYPLPEKIISDPLRIKQILLNLCSNAIKFTERGKVALNVSFSAESLSLKFEINDTGIGMTDEQMDKIFKPFEQADPSTTRKYGGTGLGLTLSKQLVEMLNGSISVTSIENKGSQFTVNFEIIEDDNFKYIYNSEKENTFEKDNDLSEIPKLTGKVLLAEDNIDIRDLVKLLVKKVGIEIDVVENGKEAIKAALKSEYDLILLDIQMPVMDGLSAMKILNERGYKPPVCAMTANAMQEDRDECKAAGFSGFISKPINRDDLYTLLAKYLKPCETDERDKAMLTSVLLEEDPELIDLIDRFISRLPTMRERINEAHFEKDDDELSSLIHQMKGVGGNYGYPTLTELCAKIEFQITSKHTENVVSLIEEFNLLTEKIILGYNENHKLVSQ